MAVFCWAPSNESWVQMAPKDTHGSHFFIPSMDLAAMEAEGNIGISATVDSTVVTVRGDYDQIDITMWVGDTITRAFATNTVGNLLILPLKIRLF